MNGCLSYGAYAAISGASAACRENGTAAAARSKKRNREQKKGKKGCAFLIPDTRFESVVLLLLLSDPTKCYLQIMGGGLLIIIGNVIGVSVLSVTQEVLSKLIRTE